MEENIATRLKLLLETKGLTNSQFADACGIPRPTLSQILTGRNKKISDVLVGQIHRTFSDVSILWLLFGEGNMFESGDDGDENVVENINFAGEYTNIGENGEEIDVNTTLSTPYSSANKQFKSTNSHPSARIEIAKNSPQARKISHITVYYDDSTFETFFPKK